MSVQESLVEAWAAYCRVGGTTHVPVRTLNILKEVAVIFITSTIVWPQVKKQGGNTGLPIKRIGLKIYWVWPCPSEQDPLSPSVSLSHQEASISLLSFSIKGQNENHIHRKLTNLITWATALSNSMKLWAMLCRATQDDPRVMVESSDKTWSTREGNGKPLQYSCLENPMNSMKRQKEDILLL